MFSRKETKLDFPELIALLQSDEEKPETIYDDLNSLYETALGRGEGAEAKILELEKSNEALLQQISELKSKNYDLMVSANIPQDSEPVEDSGEDEDDSESITIDDLFKEGEE